LFDRGRGLDTQDFRPGWRPFNCSVLPVPRFFGLFGARQAQIGLLDPKTETMLTKMGPGEERRAIVKSVYAPEEKDNPRVTILID